MFFHPSASTSAPHPRRDGGGHLREVIAMRTVATANRCRTCRSDPLGIRDSEHTKESADVDLGIAGTGAVAAARDFGVRVQTRSGEVSGFAISAEA